MLARRFFAHDGPKGPELRRRLQRAGFRATVTGENIIYAARASAQGFVRDWMNSPPHRSNILYRPFAVAGIGVVVGKPLSPTAPGATSVMNFGARPARRR
jgi:uncharacterized protein YkwD